MSMWWCASLTWTCSSVDSKPLPFLRMWDMRVLRRSLLLRPITLLQRWQTEEHTSDMFGRKIRFSTGVSEADANVSFFYLAF